MGCTCKKPKIQKIGAESMELPQTGYQFVDPFAEDISRRILSSYFGSPGEYEGLIAQERDIPIEGTAGLTEEQEEARRLATGLGEFNNYVTEGAGVAREGIDATKIGVNQLGAGAATLAEATRLAKNPAEGIRAFSDPFEQQVVQQAIRDITEQSEQQGIANRAGAVDAGAFGGSRGRLQETERQEALGRGLLEAVGGIRSQGFQNAVGAAANQVGQLGTLGQGMGTTGLAYGTLGQGIGGLGTSIANLGATGQGLLTDQIGTFENLGRAEQGTMQDFLSRRFRAADVLADEPFTRLQRGQALLAGLPMGGISGGTGAQMYQPQTYSMPSSLQRGIGTLGQLGTALGQFGMKSDKRLKTNIKKLGSVNGINIYSWTWNKLAKLMGVHLNNPITTGVMAQEVMHIPGVVNLDNDGFYSINYKILDNLIIK